MPLSDITDPAAVRSAIAEYDRLGRDDFLRRYHFGRAREYFLIHEGGEYDSKAILGAAHGYQFPDRGPLRPQDFTGGDASTARRLRELGFDVERRARSTNSVQPAGDRAQSLAEELVEDVANPLRGGGQGRGLSGPERKAVELCAVEMAKTHYRARWDTVEDVGATRCYDLECRSGDRVLRVEVKGTTGRASSILLTANEVEHARASAGQVALYVVSGIALHREPGAPPSASGGTPRIFEPWDIAQCSLRPVAYECTLPGSV
jgi:hypothetical protein